MQSDFNPAAQSAAHGSTGAPADSAPPVQYPSVQYPSVQYPPIHPSAAVFPPMPEAEFAALVADVREKGQLEAVWLWQGQVVDGRHRVRACQALGVPAKTRDWDGQGGSLLEFIVSANLRRRHLKESQRAMVAARMVPHFEEEALKRKRSGDLVDQGRQGRSSEQAARCLNISGRCVLRAREVLRNGVPELISRIDRGEMTIRPAAKIAAFPHEEQRRLLSLSPRELAATIRPAKPEEPVASSTPASPPSRPVLTKAEMQRDEGLVQLFFHGPGDLRRCDLAAGLRLKLSKSNWFNELRDLSRSPNFPDLLDRGVLVLRSDERER